MNKQLDAEILQVALEHFEEVGAFARDTRLPVGILDRYQVGLLLREPTFCDASYKIGGFISPVRFVILSSQAKCLDAVASQSWGLCVWERGRVFKIIDRIEDGYLLQLTLLEIPEELLTIFCNEELIPLEQDFAQHARETFAKCVNAKPVPELDTDAWRSRLAFPIGIDDDGKLFPLFPDERLEDPRYRSIVANALRHQACILTRHGRYAEAEALLCKLLESRSRTPSIDTDDRVSLARDLYGIGRLFIKIGNYVRAESLLLEALSHLVAIKGERTELAGCIHVLGQVYHHMGAFRESERHYLHALEIREHLHGSAGQSVAPIHCSLGALYEQWGNYDRAAWHLTTAADIERKTGKSPSFPTLNNLSRLQRAMGQADACLKTLILAEAEHSIGSRERTTLLFNLAEAYAAVGKSQDALRVMQAALALDRCLIKEVAAFGTESQVLEILKHLRFRMSQCISLVLEFFSNNAADLVFAVNLVLERKAAALDVLARRRLLSLGSKDPVLHWKIEELGHQRVELAHRRLAGPGKDGLDVHNQQIRLDEARRESLESESARAVPDPRRLPLSCTDGVNSIFEALPAGCLLIEFVRFDQFDFTGPPTRETPPRNDRYLAIIFSDGLEGVPRIIDLGDAGVIDQLIDTFRSQIMRRRQVELNRPRDLELQSANSEALLSQGDSSATGVALRTAIFDPVIAAIAPHRRLFIAPDSTLFLLPFEILPASDGQHLIDHYSISYLTTARDLLCFNDDISPQSSRALVVAAPEFDLASNEAPEVGSSTSAGALRFDPLPGARREGREIAALLDAELSMGRDATKSMVAQGRGRPVLHIATHAFMLHEYTKNLLSSEHVNEGMVIRSLRDVQLLVLNGTLATPTEFEDTRVHGEPFDRLSGRDLANPLLRSCLAFAGANTWLRGGVPSCDAGNGILTAEEIACMDLTGTGLVVLSACETGLGDVCVGEGVFGLRRSFVISGVRSIVMSLWKVPDHETCELMLAFYLRLQQGCACSEALRGAQLELKNKYPDPLFWGAFVCQGDPSILSVI